MKLWIENVGGNLHDACETISRDNFDITWENIITMSNCGGHSTKVVFVVTDAEYKRLKTKLTPRGGKS